MFTLQQKLLFFTMELEILLNLLMLAVNNLPLSEKINLRKTENNRIKHLS